MQAIQKYTLRVFWQKKGNARYTSHLDTQRTVTRALVRSGLPLYYSQGYNPHLKLVFALPVSLYQDALYDVFDVDILEKVDPAVAAAQLGAVMPPDMPVLKAAYPVKKFKELAFASYEISIRTALSPEELQSRFAGEVVVEKKSKKKCAFTDISPMIKELSAEGTEDGALIKCTLSASPDNYLNPKYITEFLGEDISFSHTVRTMLFDEDGKPLE
ncbi:MAG: DUF2344 domain-containing protein [Clostridia bacterium]|nr:DUF2344 domain-containing protein [Clostridia bacterium]